MTTKFGYSWLNKIKIISKDNNSKFSTYAEQVIYKIINSFGNLAIIAALLLLIIALLISGPYYLNHGCFHDLFIPYNAAYSWELEQKLHTEFHSALGWIYHFITYNALWLLNYFSLDPIYIYQMSALIWCVIFIVFYYASNSVLIKPIPPSILAVAIAVAISGKMLCVTNMSKMPWYATYNRHMWGLVLLHAAFCIMFCLEVLATENRLKNIRSITGVAIINSFAVYITLHYKISFLPIAAAFAAITTFILASRLWIIHILISVIVFLGLVLLTVLFGYDYYGYYIDLAKASRGRIELPRGMLDGILQVVIGLPLAALLISHRPKYILVMLVICISLGIAVFADFMHPVFMVLLFIGMGWYLNYYSQENELSQSDNSFSMRFLRPKIASWFALLIPLVYLLDFASVTNFVLHKFDIYHKRNDVFRSFEFDYYNQKNNSHQILQNSDHHQNIYKLNYKFGRIESVAHIKQYFDDVDSKTLGLGRFFIASVRDKYINILDQSYYFDSVDEGLQTLKAIPNYRNLKIASTDFSNPFPFLLQTPIPKNSENWLHPGTTIKTNELPKLYENMLLDADIVMVPTSTGDDVLYRITKFGTRISLYPFKKQLNCEFYYYNSRHNDPFIPFKATASWIYFIRKDLALKLELNQIPGYIENKENIANVCLNNNYKVTKKNVK